MATILDGKALAAEVRAEVAAGVKDFQGRAGRSPGLAVVLVGDDPASQIYVRHKDRAAQAVGIGARTLRLPADTSEAALLEQVAALNADAEVDGILCVNPGSPTYPHNYDTQFGTLGFLTIENQQAAASIHLITDDGIVPFDWDAVPPWKLRPPRR